MYMYMYVYVPQFFETKQSNMMTLKCSLAVVVLSVFYILKICWFLLLYAQLHTHSYDVGKTINTYCMYI